MNSAAHKMCTTEVNTSSRRDANALQEEPNNYYSQSVNNSVRATEIETLMLRSVVLVIMVFTN